MEFRKLKAKEISAEVAQVNRGGVKLLLWKERFAVIDILNDAVGEFYWSMSLSNDNRNCEITITDKATGRTASRTGVGDKKTPKALAYDAISAAGTAWGIGRELFTAPEMFIPKECLSSYSWDENEKVGKVNDRFIVTDITYDGDIISSVTIGITEYGEIKAKKTFTNQQAQKEAAAQTEAEKPVFADDEVLLIGVLKGKKYGDIKDSSKFRTLLSWAAETSTTYPNDEKKTEQLKKLAYLGKKLSA